MNTYFPEVEREGIAALHELVKHVKQTAVSHPQVSVNVVDTHFINIVNQVYPDFIQQLLKLAQSGDKPNIRVCYMLKAEVPVEYICILMGCPEEEVLRQQSLVRRE